MTTQKVVNERMAYAHYKEHRAHIASLVERPITCKFLTDLTVTAAGCRSKSAASTIAHTHPVDYEGCTHGAYALWKGGMRYWFEDEEIKLVNLHKS